MRPSTTNEDPRLQRLLNAALCGWPSSTSRLYRADTTAARPSCRICSCTDLDACVREDGGTCWWVEDDLCSECYKAARTPEATR